MDWLAWPQETFKTMKGFISRHRSGLVATPCVVHQKHLMEAAPLHHHHAGSERGGAHLRLKPSSLVAAQIVRPVRWIIVNDGSDDSTGRIADEAAKNV